MTKARIVLATILSTSCATALAQEFSAEEEDFMMLYGDEETISIATGTSKPLHLAPSVASVITAKDIKAMGARNLDDILEYIPGLHVARSLNRMKPIYSIRGIRTDNDPQTLFLINGHSIDTPVTGSRPELFRMGVANISRIEIIRGPGSAVYGADAFSGVINVITKDAEELRGSEVGARLGSFDTQDTWIQHGGSYAGWDTAFSFEYSTSDGDDGRIIDTDLQAFIDSLPPAFGGGTSASLTPGAMNTSYTQLNTSLKLSKENWRIWFNSWNLRDAGVGAGVTGALDNVGHQEVDVYTLAFKYSEKEFMPFVQLDMKLEINKHDEQVYFQLFPPGATLAIATDGNIKNALNPNPLGGLVVFTDGMHGNPGGDTEQVFFETALTYDRFDDHLIRLAAGASYDGIVPKSTQNFGPGIIDGTVSPIDGTLTDTTGNESAIFLPVTLSRRVRFVSLQDEWQLADDWALTGGIRYDYYSDFGTTTNPRLALVWATDYNLTTKFLYGRAFRAPSFNELYITNNPASVGNPNLDPETIDVAEVVFDYKPTFDLHAVVNLFRYDVDDLIDKVGSNWLNYKNQDGYGMEADINWVATDELLVVGNLAWQSSEDSNTGDEIAYVPTHQASMGVRYKVGSQCSINPQANWVAGRKRVVGDTTRPEIGDYTIVDITGRCTMSDMPLEVAVSVRNAFDHDAREPSPASSYISNDFPLEGRSFYVEAAYSFGK